MCGHVCSSCTKRRLRQTQRPGSRPRRLGVEAEASRADAEKRVVKEQAAADKAAAVAQSEAKRAATKASEARNARALAKKALCKAKTATNQARFDKADERTKTLRKKADEAKTKRK